ncbi:hypothetical protein NHX12_033261 [Muraenolepis orangiensis]|uniref:TPPC8 C-terminal Ig-like domain-containing protein n=1 Tax=Muraenolepis orangiensis TaxID=630683 RepID=A0A9Q0E570_9TELE|nr:hypothetical protein NHX12_032766 [Muraenolepis orangiensis]KAJ3599298.1 hypothetical protein NHX12_033261 [Muraenolepis orangiensis]
MIKAALNMDDGLLDLDLLCDVMMPEVTISILRKHEDLSRLCVVPVTLTLSNCSLGEVDVLIDLRHKTISPDSLEVHGSFTWLGQTQYRRRLRPQEVARLPLRACFLHAGVYNLSTPRVFAKFTAPAKNNNNNNNEEVREEGVAVETSQQAASPALIIITSQA